MAQIFSQRTNTWFRAILIAIPFVLAGGGLAAFRLNYSDYATKVGVPIDQPVPFSHQHHVGGLGIDCRYCHTAVEKSAFAGIPSMEICMTCHSQLWTEAPALEPVRQSYASGMPLRWTRVHDVADYVYFDHSIHVAKGVGCAECHGPIDHMPITWKQETLQMGWCLECHRHPGDHLRPTSEVFNLEWKPSDDRQQLGQTLVNELHLKSQRELTDCSTCHR